MLLTYSSLSQIFCCFLESNPLPCSDLIRAPTFLNALVCWIVMASCYFLPPTLGFKDKDWLGSIYTDILEKAMAPHSSTLAWKIPRMEDPGGLQSLGSLGVGHDWATSLSLFTFLHWRRKWQPTPVFLPRESQGRGSLAGCCLRGLRVGHD